MYARIRIFQNMNHYGCQRVSLRRNPCSFWGLARNFNLWMLYFFVRLLNWLIVQVTVQEFAITDSFPQKSLGLTLHFPRIFGFHETNANYISSACIFLPNPND